MSKVNFKSAPRLSKTNSITSNSTPASSSSPTSSNSPPQTLNISGQPRKRRLNLACLECKTRKIKCDRNVPNCASCIRRGVAHKCRWGDERDDSNPSSATSSDATTSALLARVLQKEQRVKMLEAKLKAAGISYESKSDFQDLDLEIDDEASFYNDLQHEADENQKSATEQLCSPFWFQTSATSLPIDPRPLPTSLRSHLSLLPRPPEIREMVSIYLEEMERWVSCFHSPTLISQVERILSSLNWHADGSVTLREDARRLEYDEVAMLFSIMSSLSSTPSLLPKENNFVAFHKASLEFLSFSGFWDNPTLAGIQCLIVMRYYCFAKNSLNFSRALTASAIRMAEVLNLHRLGSYESDEQRWRLERELGRKRKSKEATESGIGIEVDQNPQEPAFYLPVQAQNRAREKALNFGKHSHVLRETGRRIWWSLRVQDQFQGLLTSNSGRFEFNEPNATAFPLNIDDEALVDDIYPLAILPYQVPSIAAYLPRIDKLNCCIRDAVEASSRVEGYSSVIEIDQKLRNLLEELPDVLCYGKNGESEMSRRLREERPYLKYHRESIQHWCHEYLLSVHRSYASRAYLEPQFQLSLQTSISSARMIISILRNPSDQNQKGASLSILCNLFFVLSVLLTHLLHDSTNQHKSDGMADQEIQDIKADVDFGIESMETFFCRQGDLEQRARSERAVSILRVLRRKVENRHLRVDGNESLRQDHKRRHTLPVPIMTTTSGLVQRQRVGSDDPIATVNPSLAPTLPSIPIPSALNTSEQQKLDRDLDEFISGLIHHPTDQAAGHSSEFLPRPPPSPASQLLPNLDGLLWAPTESPSLSFQDQGFGPASTFDTYLTQSSSPRSNQHQPFSPQTHMQRLLGGLDQTHLDSSANINPFHRNLF